MFRQLMEDAREHQFDVVVVHTLDRWSRNLKVTLETVSDHSKNGVGLVSVTENIDWSNPQGRLFTQMLGAFAEYYSGALSTHVKKGIGERAIAGLHLGAIPFGYESCWKMVQGEKQLRCEQEHPGGVHIHPEEGEAVRALFKKYSSGNVTVSRLAVWLNEKGYRTRNNHKLPDATGNLAVEPRMFTTASVRGILHNTFHMGKIKHRDELLPGAHEPLVAEGVFHQVQSAMKKNSGRSMTLSPHPEREYLLKGLIKCAYCGMPMWAQTYNSGSRNYREHRGSRGAGLCVNKSGSIRCHIADDQMGRIVGALILPDSWFDRVLAQVHLEDETKRVEEERIQVLKRLKRLGQVYLDGLLKVDEYQRQKRLLEEKVVTLVVPGVDAAREAGKLLEDLPQLWADATLSERRQILLTMLDGVYVDSKEEKAVVAIQPKPAFKALFKIATTRKGSGVVLITTTPPDFLSLEASNSCSWWRRGRVELPVQKESIQGHYRHSRLFEFRPSDLYRPSSVRLSDDVLLVPYRRLGRRTSIDRRSIPAFEGDRVERIA